MNPLYARRKTQFENYLQFYRTHGKHPRFNSPDKVESKLARFRIYYTAQLASDFNPSHYVKQLYVFPRLTALIKKELPSFFE